MRCVRCTSPNGEAQRQCKGDDDHPKIYPRPISFSILRKREKVEEDPQADAESQCEPNKITWRLVDGPNAFALGAADTHGHRQKDADEYRVKKNGCYSQASRDVRTRSASVRGGPLRSLRRDLDAHGFGASISAPRTQGPTSQPAPLPTPKLYRILMPDARSIA